MKYKQLGTIELQEHQHNLLSRWAEVILNGTFQQAVDAFEIIFEREPKDDLEMEIFKELCLQKLREKNGEDMGIKGVIEGGKGTKQ